MLQCALHVTNQNGTICDPQTLDTFHLQIRIHDAPFRALWRHASRAHRMEHRPGIIPHVRLDLLIGIGPCEITEWSNDIIIPCLCCNKSLQSLHTFSQSEDIEIGRDIVRVDEGLVERIRGSDFDVPACPRW